MDVTSPEEGESVGNRDGSSSTSGLEETRQPVSGDERNKAGKARKEADEERRKHLKLTEQAREMLARFSIKDGTSRRRKR